MNTYNIPWIVIAILTVHFIADYIVQTDKMAAGKSTF